MIGMRVVRGPSWSWKDQDGGEGYLGTVVQLEGDNIPKNTVLVQWDTGKRSNYRTGRNGLCDLYVLDSATAGIKHMRHGCHECHVPIIRGTRWSCSHCKEANLCTDCYMKARHNNRHKFYRHDDDHSEPVLLGPRSECERLLQSFGFFVGAKVVRGYNWKAEWGDQDGGLNKEGTIISVEYRGTSVENDYIVAQVEWGNGKRHHYRIGHNGKVDLKCTRPAEGLLYFPSHLQCFDTRNVQKPPASSSRSISDESFKCGDQVRFTLCEEDLKALLSGHGEWSPSLKPLRGKIGIVYRLLDNGDVRVQYKASPRRIGTQTNDQKFTFHPAALERVTDEITNTNNVHSNPSSSRINPQSNVDTAYRRNVTSHQAQENAQSLAHGSFSSATRPPELSSTSISASSSLFGEFSLHAAARNGNDRLINSMIQGKDVNRLDDNHLTALHHAVIKNRRSTVKNLVQNCGADINALDRDGASPLLIAAEKAELDTIKMLLELGADLNLQDNAGNTALHRSVNSNRPDTITYLCSRSHLNYTLYNRRGMMAIHLALINGNSRAFSIILDKFPSLLNAVCHVRKRSLLHVAALHGRSDLIKLLLERDCAVDIPDGDGNFPLHIACDLGEVKCVELLVVRGGADVNACNNKGETCLMMLESSTSRSVLIPEHEPFAQITDILNRFKLSSSRKCDVRLLLSCFLSWHGAHGDGIKNEEWIDSIKECSKKESGERKTSTSSDGKTEYIKSLEEKVGDLEKKVESLQCSVCWDCDRNVTFNCGHGSCKECSKRLKKCQICREQIKTRIDMF